MAIIAPTHVLNDGQFHMEHIAGGIPILYMGDGVTQFQNLKPISTMHPIHVSTEDLQPGIDALPTNHIRLVYE